MKSEIEKISGRYTISTRDEYVVLSGKNLVLCNVAGEIITYRPDLRNIHKVAFLSGDRILIDCGILRSYVLLSLVDGSEIWRVAQPKLDYTSRSFAISPDHAYIYDYFYLKEECFLTRISILSQKTTVYAVKSDMRCVSDIKCDIEGFPCLLQHHYESSENVSINGICCFTDNVHESVGVFRWKFEFPRISCYFLGDTETILTEDLYVYNPKTRRMFYLLENELEWESPGMRPLFCRIDESRRYVVLSYDTVNVVIDVINKKMVARYVASFTNGFIVDNEYWISSASGIQRKPFPLIEDMPQRKYRFWKP